MSDKAINLCMILHDHQPVGNFDKVFELGLDIAYEPFLEVFEGECSFPVSLHVSGPLLEWIEEKRPRAFERIQRLVRAGRIEMFGGGMYEPIFTMLPSRDLAGQVTMMADYVESRFGERPRGIWLPERVWEQHLTSELADLGVEYLAVDDFHFKNAGLSDDSLAGCWLTEDRGRLLKVFPGSEKLRYLIPFGTVEKVVAHLEEVASRPRGRSGDAPTLFYADDGEKFGMWPGTHKHVYEDGWLKRFFGAIESSRGWINIVTAREAAAGSPLGTVYLPDASYREMTEWALPGRELARYEAAVKAFGEDERFKTIRRFVRGGTWRNFKAKYHEASRMYARMMLASERVDAMPAKAKQRSAAVRALYRSQCNCAWWHGVFGGLYLPHLRSAVYRRMIEADDIAAKALAPKGARAQALVRDLDFDGAEEVLLENDELFAFVSPSRGGHIYELDLRPRRLNLLDTLARRYEAYHDRILERARQQQGGGASPGEIASIHDIVRVKQEGLEKHLAYDSYERESLVDHVLAAAPSAEDLLAGRVGAAEWLSPVYSFKANIRKGTAEVVMTREGGSPSGAGRISITKTVRVPAKLSRVEIEYAVRALDGPVEFILGVEFNFAMLAGDAPDRFYTCTDTVNAGPLSRVGIFSGVDSVGVVDEWEKVRIELALDRRLDVAVYPVRTVSQSEEGFELVYQSSAVTPLVPLSLRAGGEAGFTIVLEAKDA